MSRVARALVLGTNGQDGTWLARDLLDRGYDVFGCGRQTKPRHLPAQRTGFTYRQLDLRKGAALTQVLEDCQPDIVFHVAAVHGSSGFVYETGWHDALAVNVAAVHRIVEYARTRRPALKLVYASSAKVFGAPPPRTITERSPMVSSCLYSLTKNSARDLIQYYRREHGIHAAILFLFNHESELRPADFFVPKIVSALARALNGDTDGVEVETLDFRNDWGAADEYMSLAADVAEQACDTDFVVATGKTWTGRAFTKALFSRYGLDSRRFIRERRPKASLPAYFQARPQKLQRILGRRPQKSILDVCGEMLASYRTANSRHG